MFSFTDVCNKHGGEDHRFRGAAPHYGNLRVSQAPIADLEIVSLIPVSRSLNGFFFLLRGPSSDAESLVPLIQRSLSLERTTYQKAL